MLGGRDFQWFAVSLFRKELGLAGVVRTKMGQGMQNVGRHALGSQVGRRLGRTVRCTARCPKCLFGQEANEGSDT